MLIRKNTIYTPDNSFLLQYIASIESGETIVGQELWLMLQKLREDMTSGEYRYDTADALLRMDFMEHCVKLTKSPFYGKPMILMDWQKAFIEASYSFKMPDTGFDRFTRILLEIARKNTKSETSSALALAEFIAGNEGSDIVCSSNDDTQASIVYDAIDMMRKLIDPDDLDTKRNQRFMLNKVNNSKIFKLSDTTRNKEGRVLRPVETVKRGYGAQEFTQHRLVGHRRSTRNERKHYREVDRTITITKRESKTTDDNYGRLCS